MNRDDYDAYSREQLVNEIMSLWDAIDELGSILEGESPDLGEFGWDANANNPDFDC